MDSICSLFLWKWFLHLLGLGGSVRGFGILEDVKNMRCCWYKLSITNGPLGLLLYVCEVIPGKCLLVSDLGVPSLTLLCTTPFPIRHEHGHTHAFFYHISASADILCLFCWSSPSVDCTIWSMHRTIHTLWSGEWRCPPNPPSSTHTDTHP